MNADRCLIAAAVALGCCCASVLGNGTLETTYRTQGPLMRALYGSGKVKEALQQSSAVLQRGRSEFAFGTVVSADGYILTKASEVPSLEGVSIAVGSQVFTGVQLAATSKEWDVALLKIPATGLAPVKFFSGPPPERGDWIVINGAVTRKERYAQGGVIAASPRQIKPASGSLPGIALEETDDGFVISELEPDGAAKKAGCEAGDQLTAVAGKPVGDSVELSIILKAATVGEIVELSLLRDGKPVTASVELVEAFTRNDSLSGDHRSGRRTGFPRVIQHDAISDRECMGGPVFDLDGNCLGMNIASYNRCETYAIPAPELEELVKSLLAEAEASASRSSPAVIKE